MRRNVQSRSRVALCVCRYLKQQGVREIYGRPLHTSVVKLRKAGGSHAWQRISDLVPIGLPLRRAVADISCTGVKPHSCFPKQAILSAKGVTDFSIQTGGCMWQSTGNRDCLHAKDLSGKAARLIQLDMLSGQVTRCEVFLLLKAVRKNSTSKCLQKKSIHIMQHISLT